jgi:hypothetical protein
MNRHEVNKRRFEVDKGGCSGVRWKALRSNEDNQQPV